MRKSLCVVVAGSLTAIGLMVAAPSAQPQAQPGSELTLPLRMSAFAVNMGGTLRTTAVWDIRVTRWTTPDERGKLLGQIAENKPNDLLRALQKLPSAGRISVPGHRGPDPHKVVLGWTLHYAFATPGEDGGWRIGIATDRYIGMWEAREQPRTIDYPFTLIEIRLDKEGKGVGKMAVATRIEYDKKKKQMVLENYASEPVRLNEIKIQK